MARLRWTIAAFGACLVSHAWAAGAPLTEPASTDLSRAYLALRDVRWKGLNVNLAEPDDTIDGATNAARTRLAAIGVGYIGVSLQNFALNTLPVAITTAGRQTYNGQRPTYNTQDFLVVTFDAGRIGLSGGQFAIGAVGSLYTWTAGGPRKFGLQTLTYRQSFLDDALGVKVGYLVNSFEFANVYIGGNLASGVFGQNGNILVQGGLNGGAITTLGAEAKLTSSTGFYTIAAVERPISPDGIVAEAVLNPTSLDVRVRDTGILAIDEIGYQRKATPTQNEIWIRGAAAINTSRTIDYSDADRRASHTNGFGYLLVDHQLLQISRERPSRGIYAGYSFNYAPAALNRFSQYYQGRLYAKGLFDGRPSDLVSLVASTTVFSGDLYETTVRAGRLAHSSSTSVTASYGAHLAPGAYLNLGVTWVDHPTSVGYTPSTGSALLFLSNLSLFL